MAYNLQPLIQILEHILHPHNHHRPNWVLDPHKRPVIESLLEKASILKEIFYENSFPATSDEVRNLESRIRDAAYHAQNVIESHLAKKLIETKKGESIWISPTNLEKIEEVEFDPIFDKLVVIMGDTSGGGPGPVSSAQDLNPKNIVVGISEDVNHLMEQLIMPQESKLQIIPIVGMGGIGKTTIARTLHDDQSVISYFDIRAWIVISQSYSLQEMLTGLLKCTLGELSNEISPQDGNDKLGLKLYQKLWGRRYFIVLDDMWSCEAWDCVKNYFPNENNGSRILITTRERSVADYAAGSANLCHQMQFLNETESWNLLFRKVFPEESCPSELVGVGRNIAGDCGGLPLAIHAVGGVLSRLEKTQRVWRQVSRDVRSALADSDAQVTNILSLSYNYLPNYLKPCFLYMSAFPEDHEIQASKLIKLWLAEGFLQPISDRSFEEAAQVYLKELVKRNLLLIQHQETERNVKTYIMHDLLRDLCIRKAQEEKFLSGDTDAIKELDQNDMLCPRLSVHGSDDKIADIIESICIGRGIRIGATLHSVLLFDTSLDRCHPTALPCFENAFGMELLRVLDTLATKLEILPKAMERLVNLRYLAASVSVSSPSIYNLDNIQTLIFFLGPYRGHFVGKVQELFDMPQLRHIKFKGTHPRFVLGDGEIVSRKEELQTLSTVIIDDSFPRILEAIPNLVKLGISDCYDTSIRSTIDLRCLNKLEILKCRGSRQLARYMKYVKFPTFLKKLTLDSCGIPSGFLNNLGVLPSLQVFKVQYSSFTGNRKWEVSQGEFQQLRLLQLLMFHNLEIWEADETCYPRLERLVIQDCDGLEEIPNAIGDIPTLKIIKVYGRSKKSMVESAVKIQVNQNDFGNDTLQVRIQGNPIRLSFGNEEEGEEEEE